MGLNLEGLVPAFGNLDRFPFWLGFAVIFGLGWAAILLATLLTRPESMEVLRKFYRDVQPIGWWGPVAAELDSAEREAIKSRGRAELRACGLGVTFYFLLVLALFAAMGGHLSSALAAGALALAMGVIFTRALMATATQPVSGG